ncbi:hypothetical protein NG800_006330 [Epilithonimonas ginsengisoli]|uniref:Uncharacterized protein n=1 Tax=Epilithonimonas ginsengisoli TaxID=1245592 RepID=A0ABU4JFS9_9FLAO|nr:MULTISPECIES: hypothetical protein [Chryseobacterium group]MBV6879147.1 hypothetical protein [Epilithonimonas sp. FP105]MDW8548518.1 hypothetical protein [Epilithonimonas ginsengisoli]
MKSLFTFFIILTIALRPLVPLMDYAVNYDFINKNLCENKSKPQLLCNGKCYLKKEIAKTSTDQSKNDSRISISGFTDIFVINENFEFFTITDYNYESSNFNSELDFSYKFNLFSNIFHPPLV